MALYYLETLEKLLAAARFPAWFPWIDETTMENLRAAWLDQNLQCRDVLNFNHERTFTTPLSQLIAARLGGKPRFSVHRDNTMINDWKYGFGMHYVQFFRDQYWQELARKERNYRMVVLGTPKLGSAVARFRNSALYDRNLWRSILAYADVPERFRVRGE